MKGEPGTCVNALLDEHTPDHAELVCIRREKIERKGVNYHTALSGTGSWTQIGQVAVQKHYSTDSVLIDYYYDTINFRSSDSS